MVDHAVRRGADAECPVLSRVHRDAQIVRSVPVGKTVRNPRTERKVIRHRVKLCAYASMESLDPVEQEIGIGEERPRDSCPNPERHCGSPGAELYVQALCGIERAVRPLLERVEREDGIGRPVGRIHPAGAGIDDEPGFFENRIRDRRVDRVIGDDGRLRQPDPRDGEPEHAEGEGGLDSDIRRHPVG